MRHLVALLFLFVSVISCNNSSNTKTTTIPLYIGTYTDGASEGIYQMTFNAETGELGESTLAAEETSPSFIAYSPDRKFMYSVSEINTFNGTESGYVSAFKVLANGDLEFLNKVSSEGAHPCHISINSEGTKIAVSNYTGGTLALYEVSSDGKISKASQLFNHNTDSIVSHVHSAQFIKDKLFVADLGKNAVYEYQLDDTAYTLNSASIVPMQENAGPRHFTVSKDNKNIHIINEYANTVTTVLAEGNSYELANNTSTLSANFEGDSYCADIHLSNDEKFLYGSNRGENSIVVFERSSENGQLQKIQNISVEGDWPRNFTLSPDGKFLLVANQKSENISVYSVDLTTGKLTYLYSKEFPTPVCLLF